MAATIGRAGSITYNSTTLVGIQSVSYTAENTLIEITDNDSSGFREYLTTAGDKSIDVQITGIAKDTIIQNKALDGTIAFADVTVNFPDGTTVTGDFILGDFSGEQAYNDATKFSATLKSNGPYIKV